jgi:sporulation protein YlmC with PRC-barrel domain
MEGDYVDEYGINHGQGIEIDGVVWAPVNCGYHATDFKYGKLYQWGRKYGQGYSGSIYDINGKNVGEVSDASVPTMEEGGISVITGNHKSKANIFYTSFNNDNADWVDPQDGKLWNSGSGTKPVKTEYDPCPSGWRVPTSTELDELIENYSS